jgi:hypothetical protein
MGEREMTERQKGIEYVLKQKCCKGVQQPELSIGDTAEVTPSKGLNVRKAPGLGGKKNGGITKGKKVVIECGPVCNDGIVWWKVRRKDVAGWAAEGEKGKGRYLKRVSG